MEPIPWIVIFPPLAPLQEEAYLPRTTPEDENALSLQTAYEEAYRTVTQFLKRSDSKSSSDYHVSNFGAPCVHESYGGKKHLRLLADSLVELANDFYLEAYVKSESSGKRPIDIYIIAAESGVYLAMKAINFLAKHGLNPVLKNSKKFDKAWVKFLIAGEESPTEWPQRLVDISIKLAVFIHPSLPSPTSLLSWNRPLFYGKNPPPVDHEMQRRILVVWFKNHHIDISAYDEIPLSGEHLQILEFDSVLNASYKAELQKLVENLDAPCSECK